MDTLEDDMEQYGVFKDGKQKQSVVSFIPKLHFCPVCSASCMNEIEVQDHLFRFHRHHQSYIKINELVVTKECYVNEKINHITIHYTGLQFIHGTWATGKLKGDFIVESGKPFLLYPTIKLPIIQEKIQITLGQGQESFCYSITLLDQPGIQYQLLEQMYYHYQQKYLDDPIHYDWSSFRNAFQHSELSLYEQQFMSGLFDYLLGLHLEQYNPTTRYGKMFESAYAKLTPFPTLLAHTVKTTLSFKFNWFTKLKHLPKNSIFYGVGSFFNYTFDSLPMLKEQNNTPLFGVHVDAFHFLYREAVTLFHRKELLALAQTLDLIRELYKPNNVNNKEKLELIEGRMYRLLGDDKKAKQSYGSLSYHTFFSNEVNQLN